MAEAAVSAGLGRPGRSSKLGVVSWCFYDWANSPFTTVVTTFIIAAYFASVIASDQTTGAAQWSFMQGAAAVAIAVLSPVLGAIADHGGRRKPWLLFFTLVMVAASFALWWGAPQQWWVDPFADSTAIVLWAAAIGVVGFEVAIVFYNAMLPGLVSESWMGRVSGWAWALGYFGGLACLILLLFGFVQTGNPPFGLEVLSYEHYRAAGPVVAVWALVFSLPIFLFTSETVGDGLPIAKAIPAGLRQLKDTIVGVRRYKNIVRFLVARLFYIDGLNTIFAVGAIYAAGVFSMKLEEILMFGILLNVTAGLGAFVFGWVDDRIGAKPTILIAVAGVIAVGIPLLFIESKLWFYVLGALIGLFFGPAQAASRSLMARLTPRGQETEMFGLYAFSGKSTAFLGPLLFGLVTLATESHRWGMATVMPFLIVGALILLTVDTKRADPDTVL